MCECAMAAHALTARAAPRAVRLLRPQVRTRRTSQDPFVWIAAIFITSVVIIVGVIVVIIIRRMYSSSSAVAMLAQ